ncbi:hypothetical protein V492_08147, partial [Pseudogymnoascus sp. VKM F-4246]
VVLSGVAGVHQGVDTVVVVAGAAVQVPHVAPQPLDAAVDVADLRVGVETAPFVMFFQGAHADGQVVLGFSFSLEQFLEEHDARLHRLDFLFVGEGLLGGGAEVVDGEVAAVTGAAGRAFV